LLREKSNINSLAKGNNNDLVLLVKAKFDKGVLIVEDYKKTSQ
jgi:hypothetical protein